MKNRSLSTVRTPGKKKMPSSMREAMEVCGYAEATPEKKLAFIIGYLCGGLTDSRQARRGEAAHLRWAKQREAEMCELCQEFDAEMVADMQQRVAALQAIKN